MPRKFCCKAMKRAVDGWKGCPRHQHAHECPDALIDRRPNGDYGILVHDGGNSHIGINYCPFCGEETKPTNLKMTRIEIIEGIERSMPGVERGLLVEFNSPQ